MNKQGDGASTHQQERILSPVSSPPIAATFPLRVAHTLRLARIINSTEERKIRKCSVEQTVLAGEEGGLLTSASQLRVWSLLPPNGWLLTAGASVCFTTPFVTENAGRSY